MQPYILTRIQDDKLYARKIQRLNKKWRYIDSNEEILNVYPLHNTKIFYKSKKIGYMFEDGDIAIIPDSFKIK